jgi:hypothetical protein
MSSIEEILKTNQSKLEQCHWYHPLLGCGESSRLLEHSAPGTFLVRDSSDPRFRFSLSVQRKGQEEGPTSVRIHFQDGKFRLDAEDSIRALMPEFSSVPDLVDHYSEGEDAAATALRVEREHHRQRPVWVDNVGKLSSPISLGQPLYKSAPSLKHFSRLGVNRMLQDAGAPAGSSAELGLPRQLAQYLDQYPHRT